MHFGQRVQKVFCRKEKWLFLKHFKVIYGHFHERLSGKGKGTEWRPRPGRNSTRKSTWLLKSRFWVQGGHPSFNWHFDMRLSRSLLLLSYKKSWSQETFERTTRQNQATICLQKVEFAWIWVLLVKHADWNDRRIFCHAIMPWRWRGVKKTHVSK